MPRIATFVVLAISVSGCAPPRPVQSWQDLGQRLGPGRRVAVIDVQGTEVQGRVSNFSSSSLTLDVAGASRRFDAANVREVRRNGDSLWNGLAIGAAIGVVAAFLPDNRCSGQPPVCDRQIPQRVALFGVATGAGAAIDALHRDRTVLYRSSARAALSFAPILVPERKGLSLTVRISLQPK